MYEYITFYKKDYFKRKLLEITSLSKGLAKSKTFEGSFTSVSTITSIYTRTKHIHIWQMLTCMFINITPKLGTILA